MIEVHKHPLNPDLTVEGERLQYGDIIQPDDVYASTSGEWKKSPCPGLFLRMINYDTVIWVRPKTSKTE